jgi:O-antigen ligase
MILYYLLLLLTPFMEYPRLPTFGNGITVIKIVGMLALLPAIVRFSVEPHETALLRWVEVKLFLALFFIACFSSVKTALTMGVPFFSSSMFSYISFGAYLFITISLVKRLEILHRSCLVVIASLFIASLYVYNDYIRWNNPRPAGIVGDANYYALIAIAIFPLSVTLMRVHGLFFRVCLGVVALSLIASVMLGGSRAGFIGIAVCCVYLVWHMEHRALAFAVIAVAFIAILALLPTSGLQRLTAPGTDAERSTDHRIELLEAGWNMVRAHPLIGVGLGMFKPMSLRYNPDLRAGRVAHNTYVGLAAELGLPACLIYVAILFFSWRRSRKMARLFTGWGLPAGEQIARGIEAGLVGYAVAAVFLSAEHVRHSWMIIFFNLALNQIALLSRRPATVRLPLARPRLISPATRFLYARNASRARG